MHVLSQACSAADADARHARHLRPRAARVQPSVPITSLGVVCEPSCICDLLAARVHS